MNCPYGNNRFCTSIPAQTREKVCEGCRIKTYAKGQQFSQKFWSRGVSLLLEGIVVVGELGSEENSHIISSGIATRGDIIGQLASQTPAAIHDRSTMFLTDGAVALFEENVAKSLFETDLDFVKAVFDSCMRCCVAESDKMMREVGGKDSYAAVRYVVEYCQRHHIPQLTHEQIATVSNRRRPTVTKVLHKILEQEPELFQPIEETNSSIQGLGSRYS
ncbi:MAG: hypothetical protein RR934_09225 [Gordonibacter sp.]|uniref:Crp/Fnr family transcriptional regulator n=1 Tax=Gordonibacter sp. TaxID=1968902 RepID=UPI00304980A1